MRQLKRKSGKDRIRLWAITLVTAAVAVTMSWVTWTIGAKGRTFESFAPFLVVAVLAVLAFWYVKRKWDAVKEGEPIEDELSKKIGERAGLYAFIGGILFNLGLAMANDEAGLNLIVRHALEASIVAMAAIFVASYCFLSWKGVPE